MTNPQNKHMVNSNLRGIISPHGNLADIIFACLAQHYQNTLKIDFAFARKTSYFEKAEPAGNINEVKRGHNPKSCSKWAQNPFLFYLIKKMYCVTKADYEKYRFFGKY